MASENMLTRQHSKMVKMGHPDRLLESTVNPEEAVNFYQDCDPAEGENKEVVKRLREKIAAVMTDSSTSQEETEGLDKKKGVKKTATVRGDVKRCVDHPEEMGEYWCEDDCREVCKDCLIFGEHRGHRAVKGEQRRLAIMVDKAVKILPSLEEELSRAQKIGKTVAVEGKEMFDKVKKEIIELLDANYEMESKRLYSIMSAHCNSLKKTITTIHSLQAGLSSSQSPLLDPEQVDKLICHSLQLHITPGTVAWHDTQLSITPPVLIVTTEDTTSQGSHLEDRSSPGNNHDKWCGEKILSLDIKTLDGAYVKVMENGTPAQFYCRLVSTDLNMEMEEMAKGLLDVEDEEVFPSPGQGVLVRLEGRWCRSTLLDSNDQGWRCELVDTGQVVEGVKEVDMTNLPISVVEIPSMTVGCSLAGGEEIDSWTEEAKMDWEKIVHEQQLRLTVVDPAANLVHLTRQDVRLLDSLVFLGHFPEVPPFTTQQFSAPGPLSTSATLCSDYHQISPDSLLLYFDNPLHVAHLEQLDQLHHHPDLVSPPGHVKPGSGVLAPWEGGLFRATVLSVTGNSLTVLYVDHGNTDSVSWWDCCAVPRDFLFPPLATQVRLGGLRPVEEGGWCGEVIERLHQVLNESEGIVVKIIKSDAGSVPEVQLRIRKGQDLQGVGELLVGEGFAQWDEEENIDIDQEDQSSHIVGLSHRSSNSSSGTMMSNFLGREEITDQIEDKKLVTEVEDESSCDLTSSLKVKYDELFMQKGKCTEKRNNNENNHSIKTSLHRQPSSNIFPLIPTQQVFTAMLMHIDTSAVVWVIPETVVNLFSEIIAELGNCQDPVEDASPGMMVVSRISGRKVRGRVLEEGSVVKLVDIDSGEVFSSSRQNLCQVSPSLLSKPPLAIPLKLYGLRKCCSALSDDDRAAVFDKMEKKTSTPFWCTVSVMEKNLDQFPLPVNVRYTVLEEYDGNMALDLMDLGLCEVITSLSQWEKEMSDNCLDWMLDPMSVPNTLSFLPHPIPLAVGQWLHVSVEGLEYPLKGGKEREPDLSTPDVNRIGVQVKHLSSKSIFDKHQEDIVQSLAVVAPQVLSINNLAVEARTSLALSAMTGDCVASPTVGQSVLVFYKFSGDGEGGEWCRGTVETIQRGGRVTVHYTDYGHRGQVGVGQMRSMRYKERMMPVQLREVKFRLPHSNQELEAVRLDLGQKEKMMMRVEGITPLGHPMELEEILVSVWRAVDGEEEDSFLLSRIC